MKIVWVCLLLVILLAVVQGKGGKGGRGGSSSSGGSSSRGGSRSRGSRGSTLRKAAIVGAGVYVGYQVSDICSYVLVYVIIYLSYLSYS